ncbi:hypothetical protein AB656_03010 [Bifidobacterium actinocoloniiforme DSM 22766]|nr:hypothetical protein AB656_03010 [Bifidobacterium actinocoloniiforme DSM 22766]
MSRILAQAKDQGIIEFTVNREGDSALELRQRSQEKFRVHAVVVGTGEILDVSRRRVAVGDAAQSLLWKMASSDMVVGVAWERTTEALSLQLIPKHLSGVRIPQLHGFGSALRRSWSFAGSMMLGQPPSSRLGRGEGGSVGKPCPSSCAIVIPGLSNQESGTSHLGAFYGSGLMRSDLVR